MENREDWRNALDQGAFEKQMSLVVEDEYVHLCCLYLKVVFGMPHGNVV